MSPQQIQLSRDGFLHEATVSWWFEEDGFAVEIASDALGTSPRRTHASDAFEALCLLRDELEPQGWRVGVVTVGEQQNAIEAWIGAPMRAAPAPSGSPNRADRRAC